MTLRGRLSILNLAALGHRYSLDNWSINGTPWTTEASTLLPGRLEHQRYPLDDWIINTVTTGDKSLTQGPVIYAILLS